MIRETATRLELKEIIKEIDDDINELHCTIRGKDTIIENLHEEVSELKREMESKTKNGIPSKANIELDTLKHKLQEQETQMLKLKSQLEAANKGPHSPPNKDNSKLRESLDKREHEIEQLTANLKVCNNQANQLQAKYDKTVTELERATNLNMQLKSQVSTF